MLRVLLVLTLLFAVVSAQKVTIEDTPYEQAVSIRMTYAGRAPVGDWPVLEGLSDCFQTLASRSVPGGAYLASSNGLFFLSADNELSELQTPLSLGTNSVDFRLAAAGPEASSRYDVVLVSAHLGFAFCTNNGKQFTCPLYNKAPLFAGGDNWTITSVVLQTTLASSNRLWLGTTQGLYFLDANGTAATPTFVEIIGQVRINALALLETTKAGLAVGTDAKLWRLLDNQLWHFWYTDSSIDKSITALGYAINGDLWIGNTEAINVMLPTYQLQRYSGGVLPYGNITSMPPVGQYTGTGGGMWAGSTWGLMRFVGRHGGSLKPENEKNWRYFNGPRWLPTNPQAAARTPILSVCQVYGSSSEQVVVATDYGVARLSIEQWTLSQKAEYLQSLIYPRHDRYGQTADCSLQFFGNLSSWQPEPSDNDGLWTNIYLASQAFRFGSTKSADALGNAQHAFKAMHFLQQVTGLPGYPARSFARFGDAGTQYSPDDGQHTWFNSTAYPGWVYKSDTSSDEITGHQFGLPIYYDLVQTDEQALQAFINITDWILANHYLLVSPLGEPTTWGFWSPDKLNGNTYDYDERGVNSLQILSWLQSAYARTKDETYLTHFHDLVEQYGYGMNIINQKVTVPDDDNYSDDELAWLPYATWLLVEDPAMHEFWLSINRTIHISFRERSSLWNAIYLLGTGMSAPAGSGAQQQLLNDAIWCLQTWPLEQIDWPVQNSQRFDIEWRWFGNRDVQPDIVNLLRYDELSMFRWNSDPFSVDGGSGFSEYDPSAWLLPYWMLIYAGFLV